MRRVVLMLAMLGAGCMTRVSTTTELCIETANGKACLASPKDVAFSSFKVRTPSGIEAELTDYTSDANAEALKMLGEARAADHTAIENAYKAGIDLGKSFAPVP